MTTMESPSPSRDLASLEAVVSDVADVPSLRATSPSLFAAASDFWRVVIDGRNLSARMKELILVAMHATATALNADAVERHIDRARRAGATDEDIVDVLFTIVGVANHSLYFSVPVLEQELEAAGIADADTPGPDPELEAAKEDFRAARGFWNSDRDRFARLMPEYFKAVNRMSTESWKNGSLSAKEREFICIGIDCTVTHNYEPGLRLHIRNALRRGATREEILEIFQLAALVGVESYVQGARALFGAPDRE
jgi:alkylhydroperoxidase/carboxymuconolactone decarboxylase family protein YurZ